MKGETFFREIQENCWNPELRINKYAQFHTQVQVVCTVPVMFSYWAKPNDTLRVASFLNGPEAFANFRRSGFPVLTPNLFPGRDLKTETFIRRLTYPDGELNVNSEQVKAAIQRQGPDIMDTRVWWDIK